MVDLGNDSPAGGSRPTALVLGLRLAGLGVLRSLARLGVEVHGVYSGDKIPPGGHSRALRRRYRMLDTLSDEQIIDRLREIRRRASPSRPMPLFATSDRWAILVAERRDELVEDFIIRTPPPEVGTAFLDKRATVSLCERHGVPIPPSCVPQVPEDVETAAASMGFPLIIKPALQEDGQFPGKNVIAPDRATLLEFYEAHPQLVQHTMFQEMIPSGDGHIVGINTYSGADGRVQAWTSHRRLRQWLPDRGATCYGVTESFPALLEQTIRFLDSIGFVGFTGVEYAEDARTGRYVFIELNARPVRPNQLFVDAGVDLTAIAYREMCGHPQSSPPIQRDGVYWLDFHRDLGSSFLTWRRGRLGPLEWVRSLTQDLLVCELRPARPQALRIHVGDLGLHGRRPFVNGRLPAPLARISARPGARPTLRPARLAQAARPKGLAMALRSRGCCPRSLSTTPSWYRSARSRFRSTVRNSSPKSYSPNTAPRSRSSATVASTSSTPIAAAVAPLCGTRAQQRHGAGCDLRRLLSGRRGAPTHRCCLRAG